jgi:dimethylglycine dehydrogenase
MLNANGRLIGDFTVANAGGGRYFVFGSGIAEQYHLRWFESQLPPAGVTLQSLRSAMLGMAIAGPKSRELLARVCRDDVVDAAFPFLSFRAMEVAMVPAHVGRISFTGELGYEIWVPADCQLRLYEALVHAGTDLGLTHFGARALQSLRLEKSFGTWAREFRPSYTPTEAGLDRFVDLDKPGLIGGAAAMAARDAGPVRRLVTFAVDATEADAIGDEPVWHDGKVVGWVTSGGFGHCVGKSIAMGYVPAALAGAMSGFEIEILGERRRADRVERPLYDPSGERMRRA